jgi:DEAD/DEAH box helicase domain-containing protein
VDGLLGLGSALKSLAALHLMCDVRDLGLSLADPEDAWVAGLERGGRRTVRDLGADLTGEGNPRAADALELQRPTIFLYDNMPGGVGFSEKIFEMTDTLLQAARELIVGCTCAGGCPSCVGPIGEVEEGARLAAIDLADWLSGRIPLPRGPEAAAEVYGLGAARFQRREPREPARIEGSGVGLAPA